MATYNTTTAVSLLTIRSNNRESSLDSADTLVLDLDAVTFDDTTDGTPVDFNQGMTIADAHGVEGDDNLFVRAGSGGDLTLRMGDAAGANKISFTDSGDAEVAFIDSDGKLTVIDLTVTGTKTINSTETVIVADNHLYMNGGYTTAVAQTAGLVANYLPTATATTTAGAGVFVAGVGGTSDPTVTTAGSGTFAASDIVQITGTANSGENDGLYEVVSHTGINLTIRSTADGVTDQIEDFTDGQFAANAGDTGATITKVTVSVMRAGTDGVWETGAGSATGIVFTDLASGAAVTLDAAYNGGRTITADEGPVVLAHSTVDGILELQPGVASATLPAIQVDFTTLTYTGTPIGIEVDYGSALLLPSGDFGAIHVDISGTTLNDGNDVIGLDLDGLTNSGAGDSVGISIDSAWDAGIENAAPLTQTGSSSLTGTTVDINPSGAVTIDSSGAAIGIGTDDDDFAINIGTTGERTTTIGNNTGASGIALEAASGGLGLDIDGDSTWTLYDLTATQDETQADDSSTDGNAFAWTTGAGADTVTDSTADGGDGGAYAVTGGVGGSAVYEDTGGVGGSIGLTGGVGGANTESGDLGTTSLAGAGGSIDLTGGVGGSAQGSAVTGTITGTGGGINLTGGVGGLATRTDMGVRAGVGGALTFTGGAGGGTVANSVGTFGGVGGAVDIAGGVGGSPTDGSGFDAGGAGGDVSFCGGDGGTGEEASGAGGDVLVCGGVGGEITTGGDVTIRGGDGGTDGVVNIGVTTTSAVNIGNTSADLTLTALDIHLAAAGEVGTNDQPNAATGGVTAGEVVYLSAANTVNQADASTEAAAAVWGIAMNTATVGNPVEIAAIPGTVMTVNSDLSGDAVGDLVYLSETDDSGLVTTTAPTAAGAVQFEVGRVHTVGTAGAARIIFQPRFVRVNP